MLAKSDIIMLLSDEATASCAVVMDGLSFLNSHWQFYSVNLDMINCHAEFLTLELEDIKNVTIENSTFGNWSFKQVQHVFIKNSSSSVGEGFSTLLNFYNSSATIESMVIRKVKATRNFRGIIILSNSSVRITKSNFVNNNVTGGIIQALKSSTLEMSHCAVQNNQAKDSNISEGKAQTCAAICASDLCKITIIYSSFVSNKGPVVYIHNGVSLQIDHCVFSKNLLLTLLASSSYIYSKDSVFNRNNGGTLTVEKSNNTSFYNCSFTNNSGLAGGVIHTKGSNVRLIGCNLTRNSAEGSGGGLFVESGTLLVIDCIMNNHSTKGEGGVGIITDSQINVTTSIFISNFAMGSGGIFRIVNSTVNVQNSFFGENTGGNGGVIDAKDSSVINISNTIFLRNRSGYTGGVLYGEKSTKVYISNSTMNQNVAHMCGTVHIFGSLLEIILSQIEGNVASSWAGSFCAFGNSLLILKHSLLKGNIGEYAGSLVLYSSNGYLENCTLLGNTGMYPGAIFILRSELRLSHSVLWKNMAQNSSTDMSDLTTFPSELSAFINRLYTYNSLIRHGSKVLNSSATNFKQIAIEEHFLRERFMKNSVIEETQFASSESILILHITTCSFLVCIIAYCRRTICFLFLVFPHICLHNCICHRSPYDGANIFDCRNKGLTSLPETVLKYTDWLLLSGNNLGSLNKAPTYLKNITLLNLSLSNIVEIDKTVMEIIVQNIKHLDIRGNNLTEIPQMITKAKKTAQLWISNNPYECNCDMIWMRNWLN